MGFPTHPGSRMARKAARRGEPPDGLRSSAAAAGQAPSGSAALPSRPLQLWIAGRRHSVGGRKRPLESLLLRALPQPHLRSRLGRGSPGLQHERRETGACLGCDMGARLDGGGCRGCDAGKQRSRVEVWVAGHPTPPAGRRRHCWTAPAGCCPVRGRARARRQRGKRGRDCDDRLRSRGGRKKRGLQSRRRLPRRRRLQSRTEPGDCGTGQTGRGGGLSEDRVREDLVGGSPANRPAGGGGRGLRQPGTREGGCA